MKIKISETLLLVLCSLFLISVMGKEIEAAETQPNQFHSYLQQGIDKAFNLETASANVYLKKAVELDPENPTGYAYLAVLSLFSYEMSFESKDRDTNQEALLHYVKEALVKGEKRIEKNPRDSQAYFVMALAKISEIQWAIHQKHYFLIAQETSNIWDYLEKAKGGSTKL
jgi:hypothetical protein